MASNTFDSWLNNSALWIVGLILLVSLLIAALVGTVLQRLNPDAGSERAETQQGYLVSGVLGLMALLLGFTFALAVDRFDTRRVLVLESANAVGTAYLQAQLLGEPHRARISAILVRYTDNIIVLAKAKPSPEQRALLAKDDALLTELWAATAAGFDTVKGLDYSSTLISSVNKVIDLDASRRMARLARVPSEVFVVLFIYLCGSAAVLGYVLTGIRGRITAGFLVLLMVLSLLLILDIDRPSLGRLKESQVPMEQLQKSLAAQPPAVFDRWREVANPSPGTP